VSRDIYEFPTISIDREPPSLDSPVDEKIKWIESLKYEDFKLNDYICYDAIKAPMK